MDRQCSSCGGFCRKSSCERENVKPEPEPVAWMWDVYSGAGYTSRGIDFYPTNIPFAKHTPLYTAPPQREFIGLTHEEIGAMEKEYLFGGKEFDDEIGYWAVYRAIEAKLREKNG